MKCALCISGKSQDCPLCHGSGVIVNSYYRESNERYTPPLYVQVARSVMGGWIDLDPASSYEANTIVKAGHYYTREDNGLSKSWWGNVWCNPPYGRLGKGRNRGYQELFVEKSIHEFTCGNVANLFLLLHGTSLMTEYFEKLYDYHVCIIKGTIYFWGPSGSDKHDGYGNVMVYMGDNTQGFNSLMSKVGTVVQKVC